MGVLALKDGAIMQLLAARSGYAGRTITRDAPGNE
jgi:hypothetical protein